MARHAASCLSVLLRSVLVLALAATPRLVGAVTITSASCAQQSDNVLRYDCTVTTDVLARVWIDLCEGSGCSYDRESESSFLRTTHEITIWNLAPSTSYQWQAHAHDRWGADTDGPHSFTTSDLSDANGDGTDDVYLSTVVLAPSWSATGTSHVENLLFPFGCGGSGTVSSDYLIIADTDGRIVWYQDVAQAMGYAPATIDAFTVGRGVNRIHAIVDKEYIVEYDLSGELVSLMCRCDASGLCSNGATPDVCFDDYVHHDLQVRDGLLWALTAQEVSFPDPADCDGDASTTTLNFIMDGLNAWSLDGTQVVDWDMSEIYTPWLCGQDFYWRGLMDGEDWAHANSLWVSADDAWTISVRFTSTIIQVEGDLASPDWGQLLWELRGDAADTSDDWSLTSSSYSPDFNWQHHAWWTLGGTMMLYDNQRMTTDNSRAIELDFDETTGVAEVVAAYDLGMGCDGQGGAFDLQPSGHVVANCSDVTATPGVIDASVYEFDPSSTTPVWQLDVSCDQSASPPGFRAGPLYRAQPFSFDH
jgi:hypothetical protein